MPFVGTLDVMYREEDTKNNMSTYMCRRNRVRWSNDPRMIEAKYMQVVVVMIGVN